MRMHAIEIGISFALLCAVSSCRPGVAHGIEDAAANAAHDHLTLHLPHAGGSIDLAGIEHGRFETWQENLREIFGDEPKENVEVACKAKDFIEAGQASNPTDAVHSALNALGFSSPPDDIRDLASLTQRAVSADASPDDLEQAAVAWACQWAG